MSKKLSELEDAPIIKDNSLFYVVNPNEGGGYDQFRISKSELVSQLGISQYDIESMIINVSNKLTAINNVSQYIISYADDTFNISIPYTMTNPTLIVAGNVLRWYNLNTGLQAYSNNTDTLVDGMNFGIQSGGDPGENLGGESYKFSNRASVSPGEIINIRPSYNSNGYFYSPYWNCGVAQAILIDSNDENYLNSIVCSQTSIGLNNDNASLRTKDGSYTVTQDCKLLISAKKILNANYEFNLSRNGTVLSRYSVPAGVLMQTAITDCKLGDTISYDFGYCYKSANDYYQSIVFCEIPDRVS